VIALREPEMGYLSQSEIECLDFAHNKIKKLSLPQLMDLSHDAAYCAVEQDEEMSIENIIASLDNAKEVLEYRTSD
jgi:hypothetical protein